MSETPIVININVEAGDYAVVIISKEQITEAVELALKKALK